MIEIFKLLLGNWQMLALCGVAVLLVYRSFFHDYYEEMWRMAPWERKWILLGICGIVIIQIRELLMFPFEWMLEEMPTYSLADQLFFYLGNIHIRSVLFYGLMIFWLWRKFNALLPAVLTGWFWMGFIELTFIPQHWIWCNGLFLGLKHYLPFLLVMIPWILEKHRFSLCWKAWIWFAGGIMLQYVGLSFSPWAVVHLQPGGWGFIINPSANPDPHLFTYIFDFTQHMMKSWLTVAGAYISFSKNYRLVRAHHNRKSGG